MHNCRVQQYGEPFALLILMQEFLDTFDSDASNNGIGQFIVEIKQKFRQYAQVFLCL